MHIHQKFIFTVTYRLSNKYSMLTLILAAPKPSGFKEDTGTEVAGLDGGGGGGGGDLGGGACC